MRCGKLPLLCALLYTATTLLTAEAAAGCPRGCAGDAMTAPATPPPGASKLWPWNVQGADASWYARPYPGAVCLQGTACSPASPCPPPGVMEGAAAPLYLEVRVPADASVWVNGVATTQTGAVRPYVSQPLPAGPSYWCEVRATWRQGGRAVTETRQFAFEAGQRRSVDFLRADSAEVLPVPEGGISLGVGQAP
jgi:uncharacterized protein (TIGR03000 family)